MEDMQRLLAHRDEIRQIKKMFKQMAYNRYLLSSNKFIVDESFQNIRRVLVVVGFVSVRHFPVTNVLLRRVYITADLRPEHRREGTGWQSVTQTLFQRNFKGFLPLDS